MGLNLNPFGSGPFEGWSFSVCAIFAIWQSEIIWLTSLTGNIYLRLSLLTLFARVLKGVNCWDPFSMVLKEPAIFSLCEPMILKEAKFGSILADGPERRLLPVFVWGVLKGVSDYCAFWAVVLKESDEWSGKDPDLLFYFLCHGLPSIFSWWSWKELLKLVFSLFSMAEMDLETFLHNIQMRPNLTLTGCPMMISLGVLVSTT